MKMLTNLKNFIRHGKQARVAHNAPNAEPSTNDSPVHAQVGAVNDSTVPQGTYNGIAANDLPANAGNETRDTHNLGVGGAKERKRELDSRAVEKIVAEERENSSKLPKYPGLERWILLEKMGDGAFSNVYRARDSTGQTGEVAIKVVRKFEMNANQGEKHLHPDFKKHPKVVERANILKEVQIMRQLDHPNIVKLIDFSESRQYYYIVLELCPGGELFHQIVRLTYFSENLGRHVIVQVARALEYLHEEKGVVHRDIKPENLLFYPTAFVPNKTPKAKAPGDEDKVDEGEFIPGVGSGGIGQIKIADFGLSKVVWDSQTMTPCGTVGYTAPEIVKDERYSKSVDMWALGCVLYTLLCGFPPFYDESIQVLTEKVAKGQYTFLSPWWDDISKSAQDLISHLLTVDPDKRFTIREFLNHPWVKETDEETQPAADAPPTATPLTRKGEPDLFSAGMQLPDGFAARLETPSSGGRRIMDFRSPGALNLREVFDVGYAVHRQEEEAKRRMNHKQGYRANGSGIANLNVLDEGDYEEVSFESGPEFHPSTSGPKLPKSHAQDIGNMEQKMRATNLGHPSAAAQARQAAAQPRHQEVGGYGQHSPTVAAAAKQYARKPNEVFELSLDNASILGRRERAHANQSKLREQAVET